MREISIKGTLRSDLGKKASYKVRQNNAVPCVLYGVKRDEKGLPLATHFVVTNDELRNLIYTPHIYLVNLNIDGVECKAVLKEIQFHPVKDNVLHVDFYEVTEEKPIVMAVPIATQGLAEGVRAGGKLVSMVRKLKVKATYDKIPEKLEINVSGLARLVISANPSVAILICWGKNLRLLKEYSSSGVSLRLVMAKRRLSLSKRLTASTSVT